MGLSVRIAQTKTLHWGLVSHIQRDARESGAVSWLAGWLAGWIAAVRISSSPITFLVPGTNELFFCHGDAVSRCLF